MPLAPLRKAAGSPGFVVWPSGLHDKKELTKRPTPFLYRL